MTTLYKRFVPPKKPVAAPQSNPSPSLSSRNGGVHETDAPNRPSRDNDNASNGVNRNEIETSNLTVENSREKSNTTLREAQDVTPKQPKKPKKRKRETETGSEAKKEDKATPKKFKAIYSKFEHSMKLSAQEVLKMDIAPSEPVQPVEEQLHDLTPLPQPALVPDAPYKPTFSTLPPWLANPVTVESTTTVPFTELGVDPTYVKKLEKQGFHNALAVQSVLLPMLHPGYKQHLGDICVSARTGSGKTLAYLLPVVEALKDRAVTSLSAVVVVPTRQLVDQAVRVAEELCSGTKLKVGTALGNVPFANEQKQLVKIRAQYDPARARRLQAEASTQLSTGIIAHQGMLDDLVNVPVDHVPEYESGVDILVCTPGRLVEHIESTTGFLLRSVQWLIIDEADQLLNQNFQDWVNILMDALHGETPDELKNTYEKLRKERDGTSLSLALPKRKPLTKIVLSATMRKDLTKLSTLRLRRPKLVVVEDKSGEENQRTTDTDVFEVPTTLDEYGLPVDDGSNKPLYLLHLLLNHIFWQEAPTKDSSKADPADSDSSDGDSSDSDSSDSDSSSDSSDGSTGDSKGPSKEPNSIATHPSRVLIFVKSNENAARLSHLLSVLEPSLQAFIRTKTPSSTAKQSQKLLRSFSSGSTKILIASDAASRGLDIPDITHVINYDMPSSITSYVHRVGRTARAGKDGQAWTLVTKKEAAWFWKAVAKGQNIKRGKKKVTRAEYNEKDVTWNRKREYKEALSQLQGAVEGDAE